MKTRLPESESLDQIADVTAATLSETAAGAAYKLFRDEQFRRMAGFERLSQAEQDRIFNELVVGFLVLMMLVLEAPDLDVGRELKDYFAGVHKRIPKAHLEYLKSSVVQAEHLGDWEKLISMRYEEYARDRHEVRAAAMRIESAAKRLDLDALSTIQMLVPVQAVSIGCHRHICLGNTDGRDDLFKWILKSFSELNVELRVRLQIGKITPLKRARAALKQMLHRFVRK